MVNVQIWCRNWRDDRVIPRMARYLAERLGWSLRYGVIEDDADALYMLAYFEAQRLKPWPDVPVAAYFTHREEEPPGNSKAKLFDSVGRRVDLRITTAGIYTDLLSPRGPTVQVPAPVERDRFTPARSKRSGPVVIGVSGYTYRNQRKGENLVRFAAGVLGGRVEWRASGRGWPVPTRRYKWAEMPDFYRGLDILLVPSRVEGIPMPTLEALACGVPVVISKGVGLHDELPDVNGIHRFNRGDAKSMILALLLAMDTCRSVDRDALRDATAEHSVENFVAAHDQAFQAIAPRVRQTVRKKAKVKVKMADPIDHGTGSTRGIYVVAFGGPARKCASRLLESIKEHMPDIPVCLCGAEPLGLEDVFVQQEDSDIGGRRAKLRAYELSPAEWESVLYLDADTLVTAPVYRFFEWIEDGWEFIICKDPHLMDTMFSYRRRNNAAEMRKVRRAVKTLHTIQLNGGVWAFRRCERVERFFKRWREEWEVFAQRDQGPLLMALYADPPRTLVLGNEWNTFPAYSEGVETAGILHFPKQARRWSGAIPGRIDSERAWRKVSEWERKHGA